ncbi:MAG: SMC family ATPase [Haliscomenobacteraceae bacterium CHB4]|nr:Chromosome partition protein Smc [Saprospiraceae bacterium]MCE7923625.1 SMC family ATPase [Haliscomenobacteraceae bacterium CHB4]
MILNNLKLTNYKQYAALSLDFREGLVGIIGKNGAGKSTIFEAILYCLFGRDESNKTLVRSSFAEPKANVELVLEFTIGESLYRVRREFRGKALTVGAELFKNDQLVAKGVSAVNDELVKVLHIEREAFKRSVFSGQKELDELSAAKGEERKKMIRRMLGLDMLDDIQTRIKADIRDLNSRMEGQRQNLLSDEAAGALQVEIAESEKSLEENKLAFEKENKNLRAVEEKYRAGKHKFDEEEGRSRQFNALNGELGQLQERLAGLRAQQENLAKKSQDLRQQKEKLDGERGEFSQYLEEKKRLGELESARQRHINRSARSDKIAETRELLKNTQSKIADYAQQLTQKAEVESALAEKQGRVAVLEEEIKAKLAEHGAVEGKIGGIQAGLRERSEKLDTLRALGREGTCPTCLQPLLDGYERALAELEQEINTLQSKQLQALEQEKNAIVEAGQNLRKRQDAARSEVEKLGKEQTRLAEIARLKTAEEGQQTLLEKRLVADEAILREIGEVNFDEVVYSALKEKIALTEPRYLEFSKEENYVARELPTTSAALKNTETAIAEVQKNIAAKNDELAQVGYDATRYETAKQALTGFADAFNAQSEAVRALEKAGIELKNGIARNQEKLRANDRIKSQISDKLDEIELLRKLAEMLGLFKTEVLEKVSPGISREASDLFSRITKGKYESIRVDENFDFAIADGGVFYPIERFSGGEIDLANFCLRIAITKAITDLSGAEQGIGFLAFDEIFGSQDEERRLEMMLALNYLQEQFRQIYIVSHIESLKDYFPHILEVQFAEGGSSVVWR